MKFKNSDELLEMILGNKLKVEMKLKEGITHNFLGLNLGVTFYEGEEKWVECKFEDYASFSPISSQYKINVVPIDERFNGRDYYFSDLYYILNMEDSERTKIRVKLKKGKIIKDVIGKLKEL